MSAPWRWGVAGPGGIAERFADAMTLVSDGEIRAVASRSQGRAEVFADRFGIRNRHGSYEDLAADVDVDVVYVATPPSRHHDDTLMFLEAGKHVLCEKPFALDAGQAQRMAEAARERGLFLMEAMWSRFLPAWKTLEEVLGEGRIGRPQLVEASLGFPFPADSRLFDLSIGGGALLDLGIYPVTLCAVVLGQPDRISADGVVGPTGVDELSVAVLHHPDGGLGVATSAATVGLTATARIAGTEGLVELPAMFHCPDHITVIGGGRIDRIDCGFEGDGIRFEVEEVHRCLAEGRLESTVVPLAETVAVMATLDAIRAQFGVVYPLA